MSDPLQLFGLWLIIAFVLALSIWWGKHNRILPITLIFLLIFGVAVHQRFQLYTPVQAVPSKDTEFLYQWHRLKTDSDQSYVLLWITVVDSDRDLLYKFPYEGNEEVKKNLDKLQGQIKDAKAGIGPYTIDKNARSGQFGSILKSPDIYENLQKEAN